MGLNLQGVQFLVDAKGQRKSVVIDLKRHRQLWEDLYDALVAHRRQGEPRVEWERVKRRIRDRRTKRA